MFEDLIPHRKAPSDELENPTICCLQETHLIDRNKLRLRMKGWKKIYLANGPTKTSRSSNTYLG
jgi:hypothetical protein